MTENNKISTVTIAISAYNEEADIGYLLNSLISQQEAGFKIEEILIISDGSTDNTAKIVRSFGDRRIRLKESEDRKGKPERINEIFGEAQSDIVVILDADIVISSQEVIKDLIMPLIDGRAVYSSGIGMPFSPKTFIQKIAFAGVDIWNNLRKSEYSSPLYFSEGSIRAFKKKIYKEMRFPEASADDAFPFLYCAQKNYPFVSEKKALAYYKLPETLSDYLKQYKRFIKSRSIQERSFDKKFVEKYYTIGFKAKLIYLVKNVIKDPFWTLLYLGIVPIVRILSIMDVNGPEARWEAISSSKKMKTESEKKKIIFSAYDSIGNPYYNGGGAVAVHEVAKRLAHKYDVSVICGRYSHAKNRIVDQVSYEYVGSGLFGPKLSQLIFQFLLPYYFIVKDFDVWIESFTPPFSVSFLPVFSKKQVICLVHMLVAEDMRRKYKLPFHIIENAGIKKYSNFIVTTKESRERIRKINPCARIELIPNGVDTNCLAKLSEKKHFLYIGRIEMNQKGIDLLLRGYRLISQKCDYSLVIAGSGLKSEEKKLAKMIHDLGISDKVKISGRIDGMKKSQAMRNAVAVIIPSRFETFSLTALEVLAHGIPVISFDIEGLKWLPADFSRKAKPFDVSALAEAMRDLSENECRKMNVEKLKIFLKNYDWNNFAKEYEKFIDNVLDHKNATADVDSIVEEIIKKRMPCVFMSPHLDDAILSSGGLLMRLASKTETIVATVFTEALLPPYTFSTKVNLKMCGGHKDARDLFRLRRAEDIEACKAIGARHVHFGFLDASFRKKRNVSMVSKIFGKILPEAEHIYPTYRFHIVSGKISKNDEYTLAMLEKRLRSFKKKAGNCVVFCPLGLGRHVDHIMVSAICRKVFPTVVYWEDYPYNLKAKNKDNSASFLGSLDMSGLEEKKIKTISLYKSQIKPMFPEGIGLVSEKYYFAQNRKSTFLNSLIIFLSFFYY